MRRIYVNGTHVPWDHANTHLWSEVAIRGVSAFEGIICPWIEGQHHVLALNAHMRRLDRSCSLIGVTNPLDAAYLIPMLKDASAAFESRDFYVRPTVYVESGRNPDTSIVGHFVGAFPVEIPTYQEVFPAQIVFQPRVGGVVPPDAKTGGSHLDFRVLDMVSAGSSPSVHLYCDRDGFLTEADGSGLALLNEDGLWVPPVSGRALDSISRRLIIGIADQLDITIREMPVHHAMTHGSLIIAAGTLNGVRLAEIRENRAPIDASILELGRVLQVKYQRDLFENIDEKFHTSL